MTIDELMEKVKEGLGYSGDALNSIIKPKVAGVKGYMNGAGITDEVIESDTGIIALTIGVNDIWESSGSASYSDAFTNFVIQLQAQCLPDVEETT